MGNKVSTFTPEQLEAYEDCTFFTEKEILRIFSRYQGLAPDTVPYDMTGKEAQTVRIPHAAILNMPELKENPFKEQICKVFSEPESGQMTFEEFLDMFSVFSESAPRDVKAVYAFKIYDWDGDGHLNKSDLRATLLKLTQEGLTEDEASFVVDKVLEEADLDDDSMLSFVEFEHVISRAPDFLNTFHIRI
ncbi:calcium and integrin-binding family member 2-like [Babylonia areolata]|uniref:calcium and integrin-binding family member 2-like n=1 Tax=Babylonia areolata TaxID=304850 RepID=UPI003FD2CD1B